jgi:hypothetical protein
MPGFGGGTLKILISILATNSTYILHTMLEDIQEHMRALTVQHDSSLATLTTLRQQLEAQQNDEQTDSLENPIPDTIGWECGI